METVSTAADRQGAHDAALNLFFPTEEKRVEHDVRVQALIARNAALLAIETARGEAAVTKKDLAATVEMDASALRKLLTAVGPNPTTDSVFRLFAALGISLTASTPSGKTFELI